MANDERITRPTLDRTAPIRNWTALLGAFTAGGNGSAAHDGGASAGARPGFSEAISRSVEIGYRVVDEYIRQGQRAARILGQGGTRPDQWTGDARDLGQRMAHYASELVGAWLELLDRANVAPGVQAASAPGTAPAAPPVQESAPAAAAPVRIAIESTRPVDVLVDLRASVTAGDLIIHALRACEAWKPRIEDVAFRAGQAGEAPVLRVRVPAHHPPGVYEGLVIDGRTNRPVGVVRVSLGGPEQSPG
jgi:hypothetical protein